MAYKKYKPNNLKIQNEKILTISQIKEKVRYSPENEPDYEIYEDDIKNHIRFLSLTISKYFVTNIYSLEFYLRELLYKNIDDFQYVYKKANKLRGFKSEFLKFLDDILFQNLDYKFPKNYFYNYELNENGWWHYCDSCVSFSCCDEFIDKENKKKIHICKQCKHRLEITL